MMQMMIPLLFCSSAPLLFKVILLWSISILCFEYHTFCLIINVVPSADIFEYFWIFLNIWRYMKIYEDIWRYVKISPWRWRKSTLSPTVVNMLEYFRVHMFLPFVNVNSCYIHTFTSFIVAIDEPSASFLHCHIIMTKFVFQFVFLFVSWDYK
jgi:hypothetical protein